MYLNCVNKDKLQLMHSVRLRPEEREYNQSNNTVHAF